MLKRDLTGIVLAALLHLALILAWQMARKLDPEPQGQDEAIQWLRLPAPGSDKAAPDVPEQALEQPRPLRQRATRSVAPRQAAPAPPTEMISTEPAQESAPASAPLAAEPATPSAESILESARRSAGEIDRALRKERKPTIVAPRDSPQIRLRAGMQLAHELAPPALWEAPKVQELVNNTGDGARRTRVITGRRTYCITERSPVTNVEMIEMHGKLRLTNCPSHEEPPKAQAWRTARDP